MEKKTILLFVSCAIVIGISVAGIVAGSFTDVLPYDIIFVLAAALIFFWKKRWSVILGYILLLLAPIYFFFTDHSLALLFTGLAILVPAIYLIFERQGKTALMIGMLLIIIAGSIIPYYNAPKGYFIWDDIPLIRDDHQIKSWNFLPKVFSRDFFGYNEKARKYGYYRPLVTISYMIDWNLWNIKSAGYHYTNIWFHILNGLLVFAILLKLFRRKPLIPLIGTLLFVTTPIHTESVTWIAGRTDPICSLLFFLAFYFYITFFNNLAVGQKNLLKPELQTHAEKLAKEKHSYATLLLVLGCFFIPVFVAAHKILPPFVREIVILLMSLGIFLFIYWKRNNNNGWVIPLAMSLFFFGLSLFAKEMAFSLPIIVALYTACRSTDFNWEKIFTEGRWTSLLFFAFAFLFYGLVTIGYVLIRVFLVSFSDQARDPFDFVATVLSFVKTILLYIWKMLFPVYLNAYMQNELVEEVFTVNFLVPFGFLVALLVCFFYFFKRNRPLSFAIGFILITFLPISNFIRISGPADMGFMSSERFLYIPSLGICIILAMLIGHYIKRVGRIQSNDKTTAKKSSMIIASVLLAAILLSYTSLTILRNRDWYDNETFFIKTLERAPNAPILYMLLGNVYSIEQKWDKAEEALKMAIEYLSPRDREEPTWIYSDLAGVYAKQGLYEKALETMKLASKSKMHNSAVEFNYGEIYRKMGDLEKAVAYYQRSLGINADNLQALVKLGFCYQILGKFELSNRAYISAAHLLPGDADILNNIGYNYSRLGDSRRALEFFKNAIAKDPNFARAHTNLGMELIKMKKDIPFAVETLKIAIRLDPKLVEPRLALGIIIFKNNPDKAFHIFKKAYKMNQKNVRTLLYLGLYYKNTGNPEEARTWFEKVLKIDPENIEAQKLLLSLEIE